jgi:DNA-binding NarL/FixJ family response regulator
MTYPTTPISLTLRQEQVLALYAQRIKREQIAARLSISIKTVDIMLDRCQERLYLKDRWQLRDYARANGYDKIEVAV